MKISIAVVALALRASADPAPEQAALIADSQRFGTSCADIAELERIQSTATPPIAAQYQVAIDARRQKGAQSLKAIGAALSPNWTRAYFAAADNPDGSSNDGTQPAPKVVIAEARARLQALRCVDEPRVAKMLSVLAELESGIDRVIADEVKCRSNAACVATRVAAHVCLVLESRRDTAQAIATERANPGGVVDLARLHDLGEQLQADDAELKASKANYLALAKKPFSEKLCRAPAGAVTN